MVDTFSSATKKSTARDANIVCCVLSEELRM